MVVTFINNTDYPTAIHWHGLRLDNRFDGVPHVTQDPVPPGGRFEYRVTFPDPGLFWYHPHHREDVLQDLGLYGNLIVRSREPGFFGPAHREETLMLDDLLVADSGLVGYGRDTPTHALMGRFGNHLMVNGEPRWESAGAARRGGAPAADQRVEHARVQSVVRARGARRHRARMKVVASDIGRYPREAWVDNITIAPAERFIVDARFDGPGTFRWSTAFAGSITSRRGSSRSGSRSERYASTGGGEARLRSCLQLASQRRRRRDRARSLPQAFHRPLDHQLLSACRRPACRFRCGRC